MNSSSSDDGSVSSEDDSVGALIYKSSITAQRHSLQLPSLPTHVDDQEGFHLRLEPDMSVEGREDGDKLRHTYIIGSSGKGIMEPIVSAPIFALSTQKGNKGQLDIGKPSQWEGQYSGRGWTKARALGYPTTKEQFSESANQYFDQHLSRMEITRASVGMVVVNRSII